MKLLKTIRFDASDERVYELAAAPEEWAVSGAFTFAGLAPEADRRQDETGLRQRLSRPLQLRPLDLCHRGRSEARGPGGGRGRLAQHFVAAHGAPGLEAALPAAKEEARFVLDLCRDAPINTVFTVRRTRDAQGQIKEEFRTIRPPTGEPLHAKVWTVVDE